MRKLAWILLAAALLIASAAFAETDGSVVDIRFENGSALFDAEGVRIDDGVMTITNPGTYRLSGEIDNFQIALLIGKKAETTLILDNLKLHCGYGPCIYADAGELIIRAENGSQNELGDTPERKDKPNDVLSDSAVFAGDDMTIEGGGELSVVSYLGHAVQCKDNLLVRDVKLSISAANDGMRGNDGVTVESGDITIVAAGDGIQSSNADNGKGNIYITGGNIDIEAGKDGLQAVGTLTIIGGNITVKTEQ